MWKKARAALGFYAAGFPAAAAVVSTALLAPFNTWTASALAALVGASAWAGMIRRRSTLQPARDRSTGSR
jgi:hypothetical protein